MAENSKNPQNLHLNANNSYKESSDDFGVTETFVELDLLNIFGLYSFSLPVMGKQSRQNLHLNANNSYKDTILGIDIFVLRMIQAKFGLNRLRVSLYRSPDLNQFN